MLSQNLAHSFTRSCVFFLVIVISNRIRDLSIEMWPLFIVSSLRFVVKLKFFSTKSVLITNKMWCLFLIWSLILVDRWERRSTDGAFRSDVNDFGCVACQVEFFFSKLMRKMGGVSSLFVYSHDLSHSLISKSGTCLRMVRLN